MSAAEMMDRYPRRTENGATRERAQQWMRAEREEMSEENERTRARRAEEEEEAESEREQTEEEEEGEEGAHDRDQYQQQPQMSQHRERAPLQPLRLLWLHRQNQKQNPTEQGNADPPDGGQVRLLPPVLAQCRRGTGGTELPPRRFDHRLRGPELFPDND